MPELKLVVFGASGLLGSRLVDEALQRGHLVTAVGRDVGRLDDHGGRVATRSADATVEQDVAAVSAGCDVALSAVTQHADPGVLVAAAHGLLAGLERAGVVDWSYLSPGALLEPGERTGRYRTGEDELLTDERGRSRITMEDFALAMLDEAEHPRHPRRRFTVAH